jgi:hypothetical protein
MGTVVSVAFDLETETCWRCGIAFGMPRRYKDHLLQYGETFWCPKGCQLRYGTPEVDKLKKKLADQKAAYEKRLQWADQRETAAKRRADSAERSKAATKGHLTRHKKRTAAGVCPVCSRSFNQLRRHMKSKHPNFDPTADG